MDAHFLGRTAAFVRGAEAILLVSLEGETRARRQRWTGKQIAAETHSASHR